MSTGTGALRLVNRWRVAGVLIAAASLTWAAWLVNSETFALDPTRLEVSHLVYTSPELVRDAIDLPPDATPNVFRIDTRRMERALAALSAVADADVSVALPDSIAIDITERTPTFVLSTRTAAFVVDVDGFILDELAPSEASGVGLPTVDDLRQQFAPALAVGGRLDEISIDTSLRLLALTPADLGSRFDALEVRVEDTDGYVLTAEPAGWQAVFGHYTPSLRPVDLIDRQVQCLRSRLAVGEDAAVIYLAPQGEHCGTYLPGRSVSPDGTGVPGTSVSPPPRP